MAKSLKFSILDELYSRRPSDLDYALKNQGPAALICAFETIFFPDNRNEFSYQIDEKNDAHENIRTFVANHTQHNYFQSLGFNC